jgi:protein phosphatase
MPVTAGPVEMVSRTNTGLVREINEDSLAIFPEHGLALLADGMGGHNAGEVASQLTLETIAEQLLAQAVSPAPGQQLVQAVEAANSMLLETVSRQPELEGMATTVVLARLSGDRLIHAHVGDSRLYLIRGSRIEQLTSDHSMVQEMIDQGVFASMEEALDAGVPPSVLTRGLGIEERVAVDVGEMAVDAGDVFLLCSDGLSGMVSDQDILTAMDSANGNLGQAADRLVELALENGGIDNISLILMRQGDNKLG